MNVWIYIIVYWVWYFLTRRKAGWPFFGNLLFGLYVILAVQGDLLEKYNLVSRLTNFNLWLMTIGITLHHLTVLSQKRGFGVVKLEKIHAQISHILMFVPYGINSVLVGLVWQDNLFIVISLLISVLGVLVGLHKVKLPY